MPLQSLFGKSLWLVAALLAVTSLGCQEPAEVIADHFEAMALLAEHNSDDCAAMGEALGGYLGEHRQALEEAATKTGESSDNQAKRIGVAARRIDVVVQPCRFEASVDTYARDLGSLTLRATGLQ